METPDTPLEISCADVKVLRDAATPLVLIDCREVEEHRLVRIEGAKLIPMSEFTTRVGELGPPADAPLVIHCHHGGRSAQVAMWLRGQGYPRAQSMAGGIDQWAREIEPGLPRY